MIRRRGLVDDHVDAGELLERADVAAVPADDPALHLVVGQLDQARGALAGGLACEPLHRDGEDVARPPLGLGVRLLLDLLQPQAGLVLGLLLDLGNQQLLRLRGRQPREPLELAALDALGLLQLLGRVIEVALAVVERLHSPLEVGALDGQRLGLAERSLLHPGDLLTACPKLVAGHGVPLTVAVAGRRGLGLCCGAIAPPR